MSTCSTLTCGSFKGEGETGMVYLRCVVIPTPQTFSRAGLSGIITYLTLDNVI